MDRIKDFDIKKEKNQRGFSAYFQCSLSI